MQQFQTEGKHAQTQLTTAQASLTIDVAAKGVWIKTLIADSSANHVTKAVFVVVKLGVQQFSVKQNMNDQQLSAFAIDFTQKHPLETLQDLILMFKMARSGSFTKHYQMIDGTVLFDWFDQYLELKDQHRIQVHQDRKQEKQAEELPEKQRELAAKWCAKIKGDIKSKTITEQRTVRGSNSDMQLIRDNITEMDSNVLQSIFMQMNSTNHFGSWDDDMAIINEELSKRKSK